MQLLDTQAVGVRREKMYRIDDHIVCAVAGLTGALHDSPKNYSKFCTGR